MKITFIITTLLINLLFYNYVFSSDFNNDIINGDWICNINDNDISLVEYNFDDKTITAYTERVTVKSNFKLLNINDNEYTIDLESKVTNVEEKDGEEKPHSSKSIISQIKFLGPDTISVYSNVDGNKNNYKCIRWNKILKVFNVK